MMSTRRGFLGALAAAIAGSKVVEMVLDPERLLWRPGAKLISIPAPLTVAANHLLAADWISAETLRILTNRLVIADKLNAEYSKDFSFLAGERWDVKYPQRYIA